MVHKRYLSQDWTKLNNNSLNLTSDLNNVFHEDSLLCLSRNIMLQQFIIPWSLTLNNVSCQECCLSWSAIQPPMQQVPLQLQVDLVARDLLLEPEWVRWVEFDPEAEQDWFHVYRHITWQSVTVVAIHITHVAQEYKHHQVTSFTDITEMPLLQWAGLLWVLQNRFFSCIIDLPHLCWYF